MTLSEAILAGAKRHPQCKWKYFAYEEGTGKILGSCALGAALLAALEERLHKQIETKEDMWGALNKLDYATPTNAIEGLFQPLGMMRQEIIEMNDTQGLTREAIAARVAAKEE